MVAARDCSVKQKVERPLYLDGPRGTKRPRRWRESGQDHRLLLQHLSHSEQILHEKFQVGALVDCYLRVKFGEKVHRSGCFLVASENALEELGGRLVEIDLLWKSSIPVADGSASSGGRFLSRFAWWRAIAWSIRARHEHRGRYAILPGICVYAWGLDSYAGPRLAPARTHQDRAHRTSPGFWPAGRTPWLDACPVGISSTDFSRALGRILPSYPEYLLQNER